MRIFNGLVIAVAAMSLAACDGSLNLGSVTRTAPERIMLADGTVVAGAEGWCVDQSTSRARDDHAVVVLGSCAAIAGNVLAPRPDIEGLVTVSVDTEVGASPSTEQLEGFFGTDAGRAALARDGRPESVKILETQTEDDILILHAADKSAPPGTDPEVWRALFDLQGRFISVSLYGLVNRPIGRDEGLAALSAQVDTLREANDG